MFISITVIDSVLKISKSLKIIYFYIFIKYIKIIYKFFLFINYIYMV